MALGADVSFLDNQQFAKDVQRPFIAPTRRNMPVVEELFSAPFSCPFMPPYRSLMTFRDCPSSEDGGAGDS